MGFFRHHAIVVTCADEKRTQEVRHVADMMGCIVSNVVHGNAEDAYSFFVAPDGAKELCEGTSADHDYRRGMLIAWFVDQNEIRGKFPFDWVELEFGCDTGGAKILRHQDDPRDEATKAEHRLIPREPLMTWNQTWNQVMLYREITQISVSTPCPRCGTTPLRMSGHFLFNVDALVLNHCEFYAIAGDTAWINQRSCEDPRHDLRKFLEIRAKVMKQEAVTA